MCVELSHLTLSSNGVTLLPSPQLECSHWMINKSTNSDKNATYVGIFQFDNLRAKVFSQKSLRGWLHFCASAHSSRSVERLDKIIPDIYIHCILPLPSKSHQWISKPFSPVFVCLSRAKYIFSSHVF